MKALIATQNKSKKKVLSSILIKAGLEDFTFFDLNDEDIDSQVEESGSVEDRARQKAQGIKQVDLRQEYNLLIGSDDAMEIRNGEIRTDSKKVTEEILSGSALKVGETMYIVRAYSFHTLSKELKTLSTKIPFKFVGNKEGITLEENSYPLSYVLTTIDGKEPVKFMDETATVSYYVEHSGSALTNFTNDFLEGLYDAK